ncbi:hypothetical protein QUF90_00050 [Desulfococcaceae bacterium HSG9]|nr:hypothetical protein [Desulfococcaceae bacterium HSG9]
MNHLPEIQSYSFKGLCISFLPRKYCRDFSENSEQFTSKAVEWGTKHKPCLIIYEDENHQKIYAIESYATLTWQRPFEELTESDRLRDDFEMKTERKKDICYFKASSLHEEADWNRILHAFFEFSLTDGRPVTSFKTDFILPFTLRNNERSGAEKAGWIEDNLTEIRHTDEDAETILYFFPHVRDILFAHTNTDSKIKPVQQYELKADEFKIHLRREENFTLNMENIRLCFFPNDNIYFLSFSVTIPEMEEIDWEIIKQPLDLLRYIRKEDAWKTIRTVQLSSCLAANNLIRVIYPSYREQKDEAKIVKTDLISLSKRQPVATFKETEPARMLSRDLRAKLSPVVEYMIREMLATGDLRIFPLLDDRMFANTHVALWGEKPQSEAGKKAHEALFSLILYVDQSGDKNIGGYTYDPKYVRERMKGEILKMWYAPYGNLYGFTDFSNVYVGFGWFFENIVSRHVHTMYFYMTILALYYRTAMIQYTERLASETKDLVEDKNHDQSKERIRKLRQSFARFTNQYWYREVTSQMQGIEIFKLQCKAVHIQDAHQELKEELERADALVQMNWQDKLARMSDKIAKIGLVLSVMFSIIGVAEKYICFKFIGLFLLVLLVFYTYFSKPSNSTSEH